MSGRSPNDSAYLIAAFRQGLADAGFIEGQSVVVEARWAEGDYDRLPALAADLVARKAAVLIGVGGDVSAVVKQGNHHNPGRLWYGRRPRQGWSRRQFQ
jgi:putative ABC transport system substrate-binding protein